MAVYDETRLLLKAANKDLKALHGMTDQTMFADEIFGFHAQQAVEKAFKAWLILLDVEYPRTHDLSLLLSILQAYVNLESYDDLIELNPYAVQFRYEAFDEMGEPLNREAVIARVDELVRKIEILIAI